MTDYDNTNRGALFRNKDKRTDSHPDYKGTIGDQEGREYWASAWIKEPCGGGEKFLSIALTPKDDNAKQGQQAAKSKDAQDFLEQNSKKIDAHRPAQPARPSSYSDVDLDEDISF